MNRDLHAQKVFGLPTNQVRTWNELDIELQEQAKHEFGAGQRGYDGYLYGVRYDGRDLTGQREPIPSDW